MSETQEKVTRVNIFELWVGKYPEVKLWLAKLQRKKQNAFALYRFCEWCGKNPPELLKLKAKNSESRDAERLLDTYVTSDLPIPDTIKLNITVAVKSFFKHNYHKLESAAGTMQVEKVRPYNKPSKENLRKLWLFTLNPRDKALITFVNSTAIAKETLTNLKWSHLEDNWEKAELPCINVPSELLKGHGRGKYKGVKQITFLTPEAKRDLINYKEWLEKKMSHKMTSEDNIFRETYKPYDPIKYENLGRVAIALSRSAGVPFAWHDARRYVNTALEEIRISENWARKIRGRKVRGEEAPYSQPAIEQLREKFREAVPLLEFTSERPQVPKDVQERMAALEAEQRELKRKYGIMRKKVSEPPKETKADCEDGEHCEEFKQIGEAELLSHLNAGWQVAYKLASGEVIVRRA
jgi:hypothetical protein